MDYEETYYGHRVVVTTTETAAGAWSASARLPDDGEGATLGGEETYASEDEARRAAMSAAVAAIDRARSSQGKP
jgi:hypothetical protein